MQIQTVRHQQKPNLTSNFSKVNLNKTELFWEEFSVDFKDSTEGSEIKLPTFIESQKKQENSRKTSASASLTMPVFDSVGHNKLWKILKEMKIPDHLTCLVRNSYSDQEGTVRKGHGIMDWFQIGKEVCQGCILSPY